MITYYNLRFKSEAQWDKVKTAFKLLETEKVAVDVINQLWYEEDYKGEQSTAFHVNLAVEGDRLPEKLMPYVVKPVFIKRTFNGSGLHELVDKEDFKRTPEEKILGFDVTDRQLDELKEEPLLIKEVIKEVGLEAVKEKEVRK